MMGNLMKLSLIVKSLILLACVLAIGTFDISTAEAGCRCSKTRHARHHRQRTSQVSYSYARTPQAVGLASSAVSVTVSPGPVEVSAPAASPAACSTGNCANGQCQAGSSVQRQRFRLFNWR